MRILEIDTSKKVTKDLAFWADLILTSYKNDCTIDESILIMKDILNSKARQ